MRLNGVVAGSAGGVEGRAVQSAAMGEVRQHRRRQGILAGVRSLFGRGRTASPPALASTSGQSVRLDGPQLALGGTSATERLFEARLNQPHKQYCALQADRHGHRFQDEAGRAFHIQRTPAAQAVLKASRVTTPVLPSPGPAHIGLISGVQTDAQGEQERLMNGQRYRFDTSAERWRPQGDSHRYDRLVRLGNGQLEGIPRHGNLRDVSVTPGGARAELRLDSQRRRVSLSGTGGADGTAVLGVAHGQGHCNLQAERVGLGPNAQLYAADAHGDLYVQDDRPRSGDVLLMRRVEQTRLQEAFDGPVRLQNFLHDDEGRLNAVVRDRNDQLHACPLGDDHQLQPGWNLSDALVTTADAGLPLAFEPAPNKTVDLGARGQLALKEGHLQAWDSTSRTWAPTEHGDISTLDHGLDGQAYVIQRGELKSLDAKREAAVLPLGVPHELALTDKRTRVEIGAALDAPRHLSNFAVADAKHFVTLGENKALTAHVDGRTVRLPQPPGGGQIVNLALDHRQTLHALVATLLGSRLHSLERPQWQGLACAQDQWREVPLPPAAQEGQAKLRTGASKQPELTVLRQHDEQRQTSTYRLEDANWKRVAMPSEEDAPVPAGDSALHERLASRYQGYRALGGNLERTSNVLGNTTEGAWQPKRDLFGSLRAHWHPLEGLSNAAKSVQHQYRGRDGLKDLYAEEKRLMTRLPELARAPAASHALDQRLEGASRDEASQTLAAAIGKWAGDLEDGSEGLARKLGQTHRMLDDQGLPRSAYRPPLHAQDNFAGRLANRLGGGGRHEVLNQLADAFQRTPGRSEGKAERQLRELDRLGLKLDYATPSSRRRDVADRGALLRDALVLNAETLNALHQLTDEVEALRRAPRSSADEGDNQDAAWRDLAQRFDSIKRSYEDNPVQRYGQTQASGHQQLESLYDTHSRLRRELGNGDKQALGHLARRVLDAQRAPTEHVLASQLRGLEPGASLDLSKANSVDVSTPFLLTGALGYIQAAGSQEKSRALSLSRTDEGLSVQLGGKTTRNAIITGGGGPILPVVAGPHFQAGPFVGIEATMTVSRTRGTSLDFKVSDGDAERLARHLTTRDAQLKELLDIGREFKTTTSTRTAADLDLWVGADVRINVGRNPADPVTSWFRASLGTGATVNALHLDRSHDHTDAAGGERSASEAANVQVGRKVALDTPRIRPVQAMVAGDGFSNRTAVEISSKIHLDRSRTQSFNVKFSPAKPVEGSEVETLFTALQQEFPAARSQLRTIRNQHEAPAERLAALADWQRRLPRTEARNDRQYAVLDSLTNMGRRQQAAQEGRRQFTAAETSIALPTARGWLAPPKTSNSAFASTRAAAQHPWLKHIAPANATAIRDVLNHDPRFARLVNALEAKGTSAKVVLELKDEPRRAVEDRCARGESVDQSLRSELTKPENLRIKSLSVDHKVVRSSAFAMLPLLFSVSSSAAVSHTRKQGTIEFQYGADQDRPLTMSLDGELAKHGVGSDLRQQLAAEGTRLHYIGQGRVPAPTADEDTALSRVADASEVAVPLAPQVNRGSGH